jgi:peptidoglycan/xylan/chitin deacetylase (PgdA/CDA1 family)
MSVPFGWPDGAQAAAAITVNLDGESVDRATMPMPLWGRYSHGRYGAQLGVRNLLELFARYAVRATFFIGGWDAERNPALMREIAAGGHEVAGHGYLHEDFSALAPDVQDAVLARSEDTFVATFGHKPVGFRAPERLMSADTRRLLAARGYRYDSGYSDDDMPYLVAGEDGRHALVELPAQEVWSDKAYYEKHRTPAVVQTAFVDEFEACYAAGALFTLSIHPRGDYGSGRGLRVRALEPVLQAMLEQPRLWLATCGEIADWALTHATNQSATSAN